MLSMAGFFAIITMLQLLSFPGQFAYEARNGQGTQLARWVLTFIVGVWFLFAQISLIALSRLITLVYRGQLISSNGTKWMKILARSLFTGTLYGVGVTFFAAIQADDPGPVVVVATITLFTATISVVGYFFRLQIKSMTEKEIEKN
jgi:hypothetical protein